jgi:hypothetical protein
MALTGIQNSIVPVLEIDRTVTPTGLLTEATTYWVLDIYATINSAVRLLKRFTITPQMTGGVWNCVIKEYEYPDDYDQTYNPASPLTAPFTVALGTLKGEPAPTALQTMLPTIFALAGDTLAS